MSDGTSSGASTPTPEDHDGWEWAIVEVFGHRQHAGRTREEERFGAKLLRIDIPVEGDPTANGWKTIYYGGASIFSFALCTEAAALKHNRPYAAPARYALPSRPAEADTYDEPDVPEYQDAADV